MTINRLGENRLLIVLCEQDIADHSLDFQNINFDDKNQRLSVIGLMRSACRSSGIDTGGRRVNIEALPLEKSCYLLVTVVGEKRYRVKKSGSLCYCLGSGSSFLSALEQLYREGVCCRKNSAYKLGTEYYLVFDYPVIPMGLRRILSEYGEKRGGKFAAARIKENAKLICAHNAIDVIGRCLV